MWGFACAGDGDVPTVPYMATAVPITAMGRRIRRARLRAGISQQEVADAIGVGVTSVSRWEVGTRVPSAVRLAKLARVLGVSVDFLLDGQEAA